MELRETAPVSLEELRNIYFLCCLSTPPPEGGQERGALIQGEALILNFVKD